MQWWLAVDSTNSSWTVCRAKCFSSWCWCWVLGCSLKITYWQQIWSTDNLACNGSRRWPKTWLTHCTRGAKVRRGVLLLSVDIFLSGKPVGSCHQIWEKKLFLHWILSRNSFTVMPRRTSLVNVNPLKLTVKTAVSVFEWPWLKNVMLILYNTHENICSIAERIVDWLYIWFSSIKNRIQNKTKYIILSVHIQIIEHDKTALTAVLFSSILSYKVDCSQVGKFIFKD